MIEVKKISIPYVDLYDPSGTHLGQLNEYEFTDVRVQIKEKKISGYYIIFNKRKIMIGKNGGLEEWPDGLFDQLEKLYLSLLSGKVR
jgi:hypothetical protein